MEMKIELKVYGFKFIFCDIKGTDISATNFCQKISYFKKVYLNSKIETFVSIFHKMGTGAQISKDRPQQITTS